jgi:hypothetical protein
MKWRLGLLVFLVLIAVALVWTRIASPHHARKPFTDLGVTMPLNQPGGGVAPSEAYEVIPRSIRLPCTNSSYSQKTRIRIFRR